MKDIKKMLLIVAGVILGLIALVYLYLLITA